MTRFLLAELWQGSGSHRALALGEGVRIIAEDLPSRLTRSVPVVTTAGSDLGTGVPRLSSVESAREAVHHAATETRAALTDPETILLIGASASSVLGLVDAAVAEHGEELLVARFSAESGLDLPEHAASHDRMLSARILGVPLHDPAAALPARASLSPENLLLLGDRDEPTPPALRESGREPQRISVDDLRASTPPPALIGDGPARPVLLHVDLSVLDPAELPAARPSTPFGLTLTELTAAIAQFRARHRVFSAAITGFGPDSADDAAHDMSAVLRIIAALTRPHPATESSTS